MGDPQENPSDHLQQNLACLKGDQSWAGTHSDEMTSMLEH